jgi:hypothetical protein
MHRFKVALMVPLAFVATSAKAEDLAPGLWEITLESRVPTDTGWAPSPFALTQCLQVSDARDPSRLIGAIAVPGATGCTYTERSYSGGTFRFALDCTGSYGIKSRGTVVFSANSFEGNVTATADITGKATEFQNRIAGKRIGNC